MAIQSLFRDGVCRTCPFYFQAGLVVDGRPRVEACGFRHKQGQGGGRASYDKLDDLEECPDAAKRSRVEGQC